MSRDLKNQLLILLTLSIALCVDTYMFTSNFQMWKPTFVLLTLIYWNMALPDRIGIMAALLFGIFVDLCSSEWKTNVSSISLAASIGWLVNGLAAPILGHLSDKYGPKILFLIFGFK